MTPAAGPRILMTSDAVGGVWTYAVDLSLGLMASGAQVTLAVLGPLSGERRAEAETQGLEVVDTGWPLDWTAQNPQAVRAAGRACAELAKRCGADLVHLNTPALAADAPFDRPVLGACHSCLATWWSAVRGGAPPADFAWRIGLTAEGYAACDALVAPSFAFVQDTLRHYGKLAVGVRNGRRLEGRRLRVSHKRPMVLTSGRLWDAGKNLAALDDAAARMTSEVFAAGPLEGPGGEAVSLRAVRPLGPLSPAAHARALDEALVFVSLSLYEPFGLGVLEAAQSGCALVLSDIPSFRELWEGAAVFVDSADPAAAAGALDALAQDRDQALRLGRLAEAKARTYSAEAMSARMRALYGGLLDARLAGAAA